MSAFVDMTLLRFSQDAFVIDLLTNGLGLATIFNTMFQSTEIELQSVALGSVKTRSYKIPAFESIRSSGTDERVVPDTRRTRVERIFPRFGRLEWVDVAFDAILNTKVKVLVAPLQSVTTQSLKDKLGSYGSIAELRAKLLVLYAPSVVDAIFTKLNISTLDDFERQHHIFVELIGAPPPDFNPEDPAAQRDFSVSMRVKIADGFDVSGALQSAKLCGSILEQDSASPSPAGVERVKPYALVTLFAESAVSDASLPGFTKLQAMAAVKALFNAERMFAQFIT